jgi:hypothetical protein
VGLGALLAAFGAFLPWATASTLGLSISRSGVDGGDGWISVVAGALAALVAWRLFGGGKVLAARILGTVAGVAILLVGSVDLGDVNSKLAGIDNSGLAVGQVGAGLYLTLIAGSLVLIGIFMSCRRLSPS